MNWKKILALVIFVIVIILLVKLVWKMAWVFLIIAVGYIIYVLVRGNKDDDDDPGKRMY